MKLFLLKSTEGLIPCGDDSYESAAKLRIGSIYQADVKIPRNYAFHKKYFSLIRCAWEYLSEAQRNFFVDSESFRKAVEVAAGHYDLCYNIGRKEWLQCPKSIAFDKMDGAEFDNLYERVKDVLFNLFLQNISRNEFENILIRF